MQGVDVCLSLCWMNIRIRPIAVYYIGKETEARMLTEQLRLMQLSTYSMRRYFISCPHPVPSNTVLLFTTCYRKRPVKPILQFFYFSSWGPWVKSTLTADFITPILRRRGGAVLMDSFLVLPSEGSDWFPVPPGIMWYQLQREESNLVSWLSNGLQSLHNHVNTFWNTS